MTGRVTWKEVVHPDDQPGVTARLAATLEGVQTALERLTGRLDAPAARAPEPAAPARQAPRRARLVLRRVDPWSVLKTSLVYSICLLLVGVAAVAILYNVLDGLGVLDSLADFINTITDAAPGTTVRDDFDASIVVTAAAVILGVNALLITALATLGAFLYNLCASFTGGVEVTLAERD